MESSRIDQARALLAEPMNADPLEVIVVGDISVDEAIRQTAVTFGALPPRSAARAAPPPLTFPAGGTETVTLTHKGREDQGIGFIGWRTQGFHADPATARTLDLLGAVYQLRLNDRFREAEGVTYSPQAGHSASDVFDGFGYFFGRIEAAPADLPRFFGAAQEIADSLRDRPVTDDELVRARRPLLEQIQRVRAGNEWWLGELGDLGRDPRVPRAIETQVSDLQAVTPASLQAAARRFLRPDAAYRLVVVPEKRAATR
jgi:zinc protease